MRSGSLIKQRALQRGSLMVAPWISNWVANPPSTTAHPPAFSIRSSNNELVFPMPLSVYLSSSDNRKNEDRAAHARSGCLLKRAVGSVAKGGWCRVRCRVLRETRTRTFYGFGSSLRSHLSHFMGLIHKPLVRLPTSQLLLLDACLNKDESCGISVLTVQCSCFFFGCVWLPPFPV